MSSENKKKVSPKLISDLPYTTLKRLADRLDLPCGGNQLYWRRMVNEWTGSPYDQLTIERFAMNANRLDGSPAYALLTDMSNRGVSYSLLVSLLKKISHQTALHGLGYREEVRFIRHPQAMPAILGQRLELEAEACGVPEPDYLWFKERTPLPDQTSRTLVIEHVTKEQEGSYVCRATNEVNVAFSNWAEVKVQKSSILRSQPIPTSQELPEIITHPPPEVVVQPGQELHLAVVARGVGQLSYQWFRDNQPMPFATTHELHLPAAQLSEQGLYTCRISSEQGGSVLSNTSAVFVTEPTAHVDTVRHQGPEVFSPQPPLHQLPWPVREELMYRPSPVDSQPVEQYPYTGPVYSEMSYTPSPVTSMPPHMGHNHVKRTSSPPGGQVMAPTVFPNSDDGPRGQDERADLSKPCYDKVALLVGNRNYHVGKLMLNTPENDTQDLAGVLRSAGFNVVSLVNLTRLEMDQAVSFFISLLGKNVYALFFFAGHGFELHCKNYMMPVDATADKNPGHCLCAQKVLDLMQATGAKLSIVLLDMCRVQAPTPSQQDGIYEVHSRDYNGYFVYGFSCSPSGRAFEHAAGKPSSDLPAEERENSIFVSALKENFQKGTLNERIDVLLTQAARGVRLRGDRCVSSTMPWQKPEIRHNLSEALSLSDPITECVESSAQRYTRSQLWQNAHYVPDSTVVSSRRGELVLRLHFEAEHSNVLIVSAELLNGCLAHTEVQTMSLELLPDQHTLIRLKSTEEYDSERSQFSYGHQQKQRKRDLIHFKIPDLQKLQASAVTLLVLATYSHQQHGEVRTLTSELYHPLPPPLYAKVLADPMFQQFTALYTH